MSKVLEVLQMACYNSSNPANRDKFAKYLKISDRALRREIEDLRDKGYPICSSSHKGKDEGGYYLAGTEEELETFLQEYESRAKKIFNRSNKMRSHFADGKQVRMNV